MKEQLGTNALRNTAGQSSAFVLIFCACVATGWGSLAAAVSDTITTPMKVNRTIPKVDPPHKSLEFSPSPTTQEIFRARVFEDPLVPMGGEPTLAENGALAAALLRYGQRTSPDDFASLTDFLAQHPKSPWRATLLAGLGFEYYTTAHYSLALEAWRNALEGAKESTETRGSILLARAAEELALLYARLGRMTELEAFLKSTGGQTAPGASEKVNLAREALWMMQNRPEVSFRCGPLALQSILRSNQSLLTSATTNAMMEIFNSASTQQGFSLTQVAELSKKVGLNYQMAFRISPRDRSSRRESALSSQAERVSGLTSAATSADFIIPSVVHWKVGHYAALVRQEGDRYLLEDPTFGNTVWATRQALEAETSGYFLLPPGKLPQGWRAVDAQEGGSVWGKGVTGGNDSDVYTPEDFQVGDVCADSDIGMPVSRVHLMTANLSIKDTPLAYKPPVGPPVRFTFRYNSRDLYATEGTFGGYYWNGFHNTGIYNSVADYPPLSAFFTPATGMTHDWISYLIDSPQSPLADVKQIVGGGGARTFKGFSVNTQTFAPQEFDQTLLKRTSTNSYELIWPDGSKHIFSQSNGSVGASRRVYLSQITDPAGNAITFTYDQNLRIVAVTDAIGQVTILTYGDGINLDNRLLTRVTDPFGRFASFDYEKRTNSFLIGTLLIDFGDRVEYRADYHTNMFYALINMTDMLGLASQPNVSNIGGAISSIVTPYGTSTFLATSGPGTIRSLETWYPDGSRSRVEYNQNTNGIAFSDPPELEPQGMNLFNRYLYGRNTFYWSRNACAQGYGDYSKAKIYHWLHSPNIAITAGVLESTKEPLERRVWYNYAGQSSPAGVGSSDQPTIIGRVLDDGSTQLYTYAYNGLGNVTNSIDPIGRELSYVYATNGIDLLEIRQTRGANNELLARASYNNQHRPLTLTDAAGQTTTNTYNARGQILTTTNPKGETTALTYDADGYLIAVDGPLPGTNDTVTTTYDVFGRARTFTDESGYTVTLDYDVMDRLTRVTFPDATFNQYAYHRLDLVSQVDSAGRQTLTEFDNMRQITKQTDPLGRVTRYEWCSCGSLGGLTDPLGRTTQWHSDIQGRLISKQYGDGSKISYFYENTTSRLRQVIDEKQQVTQYGYHHDNSLKSIAYANATIPTPGVSYTYDSNYERVATMTDGAGTTRYTYHPVTPMPTLGAGELASEDGPLADDTITFGYDELGRLVHRAINGVDLSVSIDAGGRRVGRTSALGAFAYAYDGASDRIVSRSLPTAQTEIRAYGNTVQDLLLQRITYAVGATPVSEFLYGHDVPKSRVATWSQQVAAQSPHLFSFGYDAVNQLLSATVTNAGTLANTFAYTYDPVGNRLTEQAGSSNYYAAYNALNQITTGSAPGSARTNEWDALDRLVAVNAGDQRTEFAYDGLGRMVAIRHLVNGSEVSLRRFVWSGLTLCEERDAVGVVTKRFFGQGMKVESGPNAGNYYYTRDHLSSIREIIDANGNVRARYAYDPYGRRTKLAGDMEADFGFAGMLWSGEVNLNFTLFRAYDPELGRWLSRDPLQNAEVSEGPNLYAYVSNDPVNLTDPLGLSGNFDDYYAQLRERYKNNPGLAERAIKRHMDRQANKPQPRLVPPSPGERPRGPGGGDMTDYLGKGEMMEVEKRTTQGWQRQRRQPYRPPEPGRSPRPSAPSPGRGVGGGIVDMGMTILTMTDCNTVNGILGLVRQGKGGSVNVYQDRMLKELEEIDPTP